MKIYFIHKTQRYLFCVINIAYVLPRESNFAQKRHLCIFLLMTALIYQMMIK